jgi:hypothetical protein
LAFDALQNNVNAWFSEFDTAIEIPPAMKNLAPNALPPPVQGKFAGLAASSSQQYASNLEKVR